MPTSKLAKHGWKILFVSLGAFYLYGLGSLPLVGPDEPRYAQVAREMLQRGDFITPTLGGVPWFEKPPLLYWMMMASYRVFGVSEFAARLGPAICGLLTAAFVFWAGKNITTLNDDDEDVARGRANLGHWTAFVLLTSLGTIVFSRGASFDIVLTMAVTGALCCFIVWHVRNPLSEEGNTRPWLLGGFYLFIGLSLLAKGLVGIVLPFGIIGVYFLARREVPSKRFVVSLLWGMPLAVAIAGVWYGPMVYRHGWTFIDQFIVQHHFARFFSNKYRHPQPFYFYVPIVAALVLAWTMVLIATLTASPRWRWRGMHTIDRTRVFALAWLAVPTLFFSLSGSKIPGYVLPVLPAASLLIGERIRFVLKAELGQRLIQLTGGLLLLVAVVGAWSATRTLNVPSAWVIAATVPVLVSASVALFAPRRRVLNFLLFGVISVVVSAMALQPARAIANRESVRELMRMAEARGHGAAPVFYFLCDDRTAEFYAGGRLAYQPNGEPIRFDGAQELPPAIRAKGHVALVLVETRWEKQLTDYSGVEAEKVGSNGWISLFVVRPW
ncbi:MAG TPA: glycosyltransferase family 39 protein [Pyrinomonadaceae bacterium]|nr:glycosyltransferase family 39 protein [Pyrinomonadaceae bacterium]